MSYANSTTLQPSHAQQARLQMIFDRTALHLLTQNQRSANRAIGGCAYRADQTAACPIRCAVGIWIPDGLYTPACEDASALSNSVRDKIRIDGAPPTGEELSLLRELQRIHDRSMPAAWPKRLREVARGWGLYDSIPERFSAP
jgi:hypothetical protein